MHGRDAKGEAEITGSIRCYEHTPTARLRAYLGAYREIQGDRRVPGEGIRLHDGYLYLDKGL
jgi:hypothetical protein